MTKQILVTIVPYWEPDEYTSLLGWAGGYYSTLVVVEVPESCKLIAVRQYFLVKVYCI